MDNNVDTDGTGNGGPCSDVIETTGWTKQVIVSGCIRGDQFEKYQGDTINRPWTDSILGEEEGNIKRNF